MLNDQGKFLVVALDLFPSSGGPTKTIRAFRDALDADICSLADPRRMAKEPFAIEGTIGIPTVALPWAGEFRIPRPSSARTVVDRIESARLVSCHSFYRYHSHIVNKVCRRTKTPYWFVPHGVLDPWVMSYGRAQKKMFWNTIGRKFVNGASTVIFATEAERDKAAAQFELPATDVIPWPVELVDLTGREETRRSIRGKLSIGEDERVLLYFGRLHHMKKPLETIEAVAKAGIKNLHLLIVGNENTVSFDDCHRAAIHWKVDQRVHLIGPVYGESKHDYMHASDAYISLSHRENFNHTAAESLAAGIPVILSPGNDLQTALSSVNCSFGLDSDTMEAAVEGIKEFCATSDTTLVEMGNRGRTWVSKELSYDRFVKTLRGVAARCIKDI